MGVGWFCKSLPDVEGRKGGCQLSNAMIMMSAMCLGVSDESFRSRPVVLLVRIVHLVRLRSDNSTASPIACNNAISYVAVHDFVWAAESIPIRTPYGSAIDETCFIALSFFELSL